MIHALTDKVSVTSLLCSFVDSQLTVGLADGRQLGMILTHFRNNRTIAQVMNTGYLGGKIDEISVGQYSVDFSVASDAGVVNFSSTLTVEPGEAYFKIPTSVTITKPRTDGRLKSGQLQALVILRLENKIELSAMLTISDFSKKGIGGKLQLACETNITPGAKVEGTLSAHNMAFKFIGNIARAQLRSQTPTLFTYDVGLNSVEFDTDRCSPTEIGKSSTASSLVPTKITVPYIDPPIEASAFISEISMTHISLKTLESSDLQYVPTGFPIFIEGLSECLVIHSISPADQSIVAVRTNSPFQSYDWLKLLIKTNHREQFSISCPKSTNLFSDFLRISSGYTKDKTILKELYEDSFQEQFDREGRLNGDLLRVLFRGGQNQFSGHIVSVRIANSAFCTGDIVSLKSSQSQFSNKDFRTYFAILDAYFHSIRSGGITDNWIVEQENKKWDIIREWAHGSGAAYLNFRLPLLNKTFNLGASTKDPIRKRSELITLNKEPLIKEIRGALQSSSSTKILDLFDFNYQSFGSNKISDPRFSRKYLHCEVDHFRFLVILTSKAIGTYLGRVFDSALIIPLSDDSLQYGVDNWERISSHVYLESLRHGVDIYRVFIGALNFDDLIPGTANRELWSVGPQVFGMLKEKV